MKNTKPIKRSPLKRRPIKRERIKEQKFVPSLTTSENVEESLLMDLRNARILIPDTLDDIVVEAVRRPIWNQMQERTHVSGTNMHVCDRCGQTISRPLEMHEIIQRRFTPPGSLARLISYQPELTAMLCRACHDVAHTEAERVGLLTRNYQRYGKERVTLVYDLLMRALPAGKILGVYLP